MKKRNIGFILFGIAGGELISLFISIFIFPNLYERIGMPIYATRMVLGSIYIISIVTIIILVCVGVILLIKFRGID
ncbi:MAG: hypothetical protein ACFFCV_21470 [Promethearchaeota archaeon]